jgi:FtsP/CotA-like multicopper oxidase with cupredoxin domain
VSIPGARMKLVGGDSGRYERGEFVDTVLLAPSERAVVDVLFDAPGEFTIEHTSPERSYRLGAVTVADTPTATSYAASFDELHANAALESERARIDTDLRRPADKTLVLDAEMPLLYGMTSDHPPAAQTWTCPMHPDIMRNEPGTCPKCGMQLIPGSGDSTTDAGDMPEMHQEHGGHHESSDGLEWEDLMPDINARTDATNMLWKLVDADTGKVNHDIDWTFRVGDRVKLRLVNTMDSDHPMHHPFHIHGAGRFLVIARDDIAASNLVWKDTVLVRAGETVDLVLDVTSTGIWMAHCHIAEHNQNGMMFSFRVTPEDAAAVE